MNLVRAKEDGGEAWEATVAGIGAKAGGSQLFFVRNLEPILKNNPR